MQCPEAQFYLRLRKPGRDELGPEASAGLNRHLAECPVCAAEARTGEAFDRAVAAALRAVPVPVGLRERLHARAAAYRGAAIRRTIYRLTALAAAVLLAVGLGLGVFVQRSAFDTAALVHDTDEQLRDPESSLRAWLTSLGVAPELPPPPGETDPFDPELLVSLGWERVQGQDVPVVVFRHPSGRGFAKVYILRSLSEFDLRTLADAQGSLTLARVVTDPSRPRGVAYVIVSTGPDFKPFLRPRPAGGSAA